MKRHVNLPYRPQALARGKAGPKPLTTEEINAQKNGGGDGQASLPTTPGPEAVRCAGCTSTEVAYKDDQGFHYCVLHPNSAHSNAVVVKLEGDELEAVRNQNALAGVPMTPTPEQQQRMDQAVQGEEVNPQDREAVGNKPVSVPKFPRPTTKVLPIKLDEVELGGYKSRLSDQVAIVLHAKQERKELTAPLNERIKEAEKEINNISATIENCVKHDIVNCEWRALWDENAKVLVRLDTNDVVDRQPLDFEDRQLELSEAQADNQTQAEVPADIPEEQELVHAEPTPTIN